MVVGTFQLLCRLYISKVNVDEAEGQPYVTLSSVQCRSPGTPQRCRDGKEGVDFEGDRPEDE